MAPRTSEGFTTPIPHRDNEARGMADRLPGSVVTYKLSPEEIAAKYGPTRSPSSKPKIDQTIVKLEAKQSGQGKKEVKKMTEQLKDGQTVRSNVPDKVEVLKRIAAGKSVSKVEKELQLGNGVLYYYIEKWGWKGIRPDRAKQLLDEMVIDGTVIVPDPQPQPVQTDAEVVTAPVITGETIIASIAPAQVDNADQPTGIEAINLAHRLEEANAEISRLKEALSGATVIANQSGERISELERAVEGGNNLLELAKGEIRKFDEMCGQLRAERDDFKQAAEDLETKVLTQYEPVAVLTTAKVDRQIRIEATGDQDEIADELAIMLDYVRALRGKQLKLELYIGEAKTG